MSIIPDKTELSEQDEEFLEAISTLSEWKKNSIIAYVKNKSDAEKEVAVAAVKELREKAERMRVTHRADKRDYEQCDESCELECKQINSFKVLIERVFGAEEKR